MEAPLTSLYQELILEHYRNPRNKGELADRTVEAYVANPVCGDEVLIHIRLDGDRIEEIAFEGQGCSISQAAVSMMTALVKGKDRADAIGLADLFTDMMHEREGASPDRSLGDLRALQGVAKFPVRIRCALLAFDALRKALSSESEIDEVEADEVKPGELEAGEPRTDELETAPTGGARQDPESRREPKH